MTGHPDDNALDGDAARELYESSDDDSTPVEPQRTRAGFAPAKGIRPRGRTAQREQPDADDSETTALYPASDIPAHTTAFPPVSERAWSQSPPPPIADYVPAREDARPPVPTNDPRASNSVKITTVVTTGVVIIAGIVAAVLTVQSLNDTQETALTGSEADRRTGVASSPTAESSDPGQTTSAEPPVAANAPRGHQSTEPTTSTAEPLPLRQEGVFSWYGDGQSALAAQYEPIIATDRQQFFWSADSSRSASRAVDEITTAERNGKLGDMVVFAYGAYADVEQREIDRLIGNLPDDVGVILVGTGNTDPDMQPWGSNVNNRFRQAALQNSHRVSYVDWQSRVTADPSTVSNGFMLTEHGAHEWADAVNEAIAQFYSM